MPYDELYEALGRALSARDGVACESLWALGAHDAVRDALISHAAADFPPQAPMAAATCVARAADDDVAWAAVQGWLADPATPGLAVASLGALDVLAEARAVALADLAVARMATDARFARLARPRLAGSEREAVRSRLP